MNNKNLRNIFHFLFLFHMCLVPSSKKFLLHFPPLLPYLLEVRLLPNKRRRLADKMIPVGTGSKLCPLPRGHRGERSNWKNLWMGRRSLCTWLRDLILSKYTQACPGIKNLDLNGFLFEPFWTLVQMIAFVIFQTSQETTTLHVQN